MIACAGCEGCEDPFGLDPSHTDRVRQELRERATPAAVSHARDDAPPIGSDPSHDPRSDDVEGATSAEAIYARAQRAVEARDYRALVLSIRPETRLRWTHDIVIEVAFSSVDTGSEPDFGRRRAQAQARGILLTFGAAASFDKKNDLSLAEVDRRLFEKVRDPDGLLAALLMFADAHGCGVDPACALLGNGLDGVVKPDESRLERPSLAPKLSADLAPAKTPSASAVGLVRLCDRLRVPHTLNDLKDDAAGLVGMTEAPHFDPIRFYRADGVVWLDES